MFDIDDTLAEGLTGYNLDPFELFYTKQLKLNSDIEKVAKPISPGDSRKNINSSEDVNAKKRPQLVEKNLKIDKLAEVKKKRLSLKTEERHKSSIIFV